MAGDQSLVLPFGQVAALEVDFGPLDPDADGAGGEQQGT
jgi:hypothetical protein